MRGTATVLLALSCALANPAIAQQTANHGTNSTAQSEAAEAAQPRVFSKGAYIPFDGAQVRASGAIGVQLYYSVDRGASWHPLGRPQSVGVGGFNVRPQQDGEYWFATRFVFNDGSARPERLAPEQKIVFDTTAPEVHLDTAADVGRIHATWQIKDARPAADKVQLEYRGLEEQTWHTVDLQGVGAVINGDSGQATWTVTSSSLIVEVRIQVQDEGGNVGHDVRRLFMPRTPAQTPLRNPGPSATPPEDPFSSRRRTPFDSTQAGPTHSETSEDDATPANSSDNQLRPPADLSHPAATPWPASEQEHLDRQQPASDPQHWRPNGLSQTPAEIPLQGDLNKTRVSSDGETREFGASDEATPLSALPKSAPQQAPLDPPVAGQYQPPVDTAEPPGNTAERPGNTAERPGNTAERPREFAPESAASLPAGEQAITVNRLGFPLQYDVESVGPSGVKEVSPYVTRDGGQHWEKWGSDPDNRSPLDVIVGGEGVYGFRIVVTNNDGQHNEVPQPGDAADVWVRVDVTAPTARITAAPYGVGPEEGLLNIQWEADDENLAENPVTLLFAANPTDRWTTIAAGLPNDGSYHWRVEPHVPQRVYLRLEVRDKAGNVGVHQLREPINVSGLRPKAHIRGILPVDNTPLGALVPKLFR